MSMTKRAKARYADLIQKLAKAIHPTIPTEEIDEEYVEVTLRAIFDSAFFIYARTIVGWDEPDFDMVTVDHISRGLRAEMVRLYEETLNKN
jgi:hypothetical protein